MARNLPINFISHFRRESNTKNEDPAGNKGLTKNEGYI
jgi:hypothetical protein